MKKRTLIVYGDEAGTMPQADDAPPFVCACVGFTGQLRRPPSVDGKPAWVHDFIKQHQGIPHVCYVQPQDGYAAALKAAHEQREEMALVTRATSGSNKAFVSEYGVSLANHIWGKVMVIAIGQLAVTAAADGPVDRIQVILDQKTMKKEDQSLFRHSTRRVGHTLRQEREMPQHVDAAAVTYINGNLRFGDADVTIRFSNELRKEPFGLRIAHYLASLSWQNLCRPDNPGLLDALKRSQVYSCATDITDVISAPVSGDQIRQWRDNTGRFDDSEPET